MADYADVKISNVRSDGERIPHFFVLPQPGTIDPPSKVLWPVRMLWHVFSLKGAFPLSYFPDPMLDDSTIVFRYRKYTFAIENTNFDYHFYVNDPACSDDILKAVAGHFISLCDKKYYFSWPGQVVAAVFNFFSFIIGSIIICIQLLFIRVFGLALARK